MHLLLVIHSDILGWGHLEERGFFVEWSVEAGPFQYSAGPFQSDGITWGLSPAPTLGQHNREVYCDLLGHSNDQHICLRENGVV